VVRELLCISAVVGLLFAAPAWAGDREDAKRALGSSFNALKWERGFGPGSKLYWQHGLGPGSKLYWRQGLGSTSQLQSRHGLAASFAARRR
jgi:hypothetical protein